MAIVSKVDEGREQRDRIVEKLGMLWNSNAHLSFQSVMGYVTFGNKGVDLDVIEKRVDQGIIASMNETYDILGRPRPGVVFPPPPPLTEVDVREAHDRMMRQIQENVAHYRQMEEQRRQEQERLDRWVQRGVDRRRHHFDQERLDRERRAAMIEEARRRSEIGIRDRMDAARNGRLRLLQEEVEALRDRGVRDVEAVTEKSVTPSWWDRYFLKPRGRR